MTTATISGHIETVERELAERRGRRLDPERSAADLAQDHALVELLNWLHFLRAAGMVVQEAVYDHGTAAPAALPSHLRVRFPLAGEHAYAYQGPLKPRPENDPWREPRDDSRKPA